MSYNKNPISGIYIITNLTNNKIYLGSTIDIKRRLQEHVRRLINNNHHSEYLQRSFNKHGIEKFSFDTYLTCPVDDLLIIEQYLMDYYQPSYNMCKIAGSVLGRVMTEDHKRKISKANKGRKYPPVTKDTCLKLSTNSYRNRAVYRICIETDTILEEYRSSAFAAKEIGVDRSSIIRCIHGERNSAKGFKWKLKEEYNGN